MYFTKTLYMFNFKNLRNLVLLILIFSITRAKSQNSIIDSLNQLYKSARYDTTKIRLKLNIAENLYLQNPDSTLKIYEAAEKECIVKLKNKSNSPLEIKAFKMLCAYSKTSLGVLLCQVGRVNEAKTKIFESIDLFNEIGDSVTILVSFSNISLVYGSAGLFDSSIYYSNKVVELSKKYKISKFLQIAYNSIGVNYDYKGDISQSLKYYFLALEQTIESKEFNGQGQLYYNIGGIYLSQKNKEKALQYFNKSMQIREKIGDKNGLADTYNSIGMLYNLDEDSLNAVKYFKKAKSIFKELGDFSSLASVYNNLGSMFRKLKDYKKAESYLLEAIKISEKINDLIGLSHFYINISLVYKAQKQVDKSILYATKSFNISKAAGLNENVQRSSKALYELYKEEKNFNKALYYHELFIQIRDTMENIESQKSIIQLQTDFEYKQKRILAEAEHKLQLSQQKESAKQTQFRQNIIIAFVSVLFILIFVFSLVLSKRFKLIKKQNQIIKHQKHLVEEKQKEILDSITYARRIQQALLPRENFIKRYIK